MQLSPSQLFTNLYSLGSMFIMQSCAMGKLNFDQRGRCFEMECQGRIEKLLFDSIIKMY